MYYYCPIYALCDIYDMRSMNDIYVVYGIHANNVEQDILHTYDIYDNDPLQGGLGTGGCTCA